LALYVLSGFKSQKALLKKLGKHKTGVVCLYVNKLEDVHLPTLRKIIEESFNHTKKGIAQVISSA
jgi:hypothetical protein